MSQNPENAAFNSLSREQRQQVEAELKQQGLSIDSVKSVHVEPSSELACIEALVRSGKQIEAIKEIRKQNGLGLAEAKQVADEMRAKFGMKPKAGCAGMILVCIGTGILIAML